MNLFSRKAKQGNRFKFHDSPNTACFICDHAMYKKRPILYVTHEAEDGAWQFLCGQTDHQDSNIKVISLEQATEIDPSINDLSEMPLGVGATRRTKSDKWVPFRLKKS